VVVADVLFLNQQGGDAGIILGETEWYRRNVCLSLLFRSSERNVLKEHVKRLEELCIG
jgi:hypothetical protein